MKTSTLTITAICTVFISLTTLAQRNHNGDNTQATQQNQENKNDRHYWNSGNHPHGGNWGSGITIQFGNYPNYNGNLKKYTYNL